MIIIVVARISKMKARGRPMCFDLFVYLFIYFAPTILNSRGPKYGICLERS